MSQPGAHWELVVLSIAKTEFLMYMNMFRVMFVLLLASSLGTDLTSLLKELSQREQGKIFFLELCVY